MKVSTEYMPKLLYFFQLSKKWVSIEAHENFVKGSDRNRCYVLSDKGKSRLTVPVKWTHGSKMPIQQVRLDYSESWNVKHLRAIKSYYGSSPYFDHFWDQIESTLLLRYDSLFDLNCATTKLLARLLGLPLELRFTDDFDRQYAPIDGFDHPKYYQVFSEKLDFVEGLSSLDYLFCEGKVSGFFANLELNQRGIISAPIIR